MCPIAEVFGDQFGAVIAADVGGGCPALGCDPVEFCDDAVCGDPSSCCTAEYFAGVLVGDVQNFQWSPVTSLIKDEVECPDLIRVRRGDTAGRSGGTFGSSPLAWYMQTLVTPNALYTLVIDTPTLAAKHRVDPAIPIARVLTR